MTIDKKAPISILIFLFVMFVILWLNITLISYTPIEQPKPNTNIIAITNIPQNTTIATINIAKVDTQNTVVSTIDTTKVKNKPIVDIKKIYLDLNELTLEEQEFINSIIEAKDENSYTKFLKDKKNEIKFYGFAGALKYMPSIAIANLDSMLLSNSPVTLKYQQQDINTTLGYVTILLINETPNTFLGEIAQTTFKNMEEKIKELYLTNFSKNTPLSAMYNSMLKNKFKDIHKEFNQTYDLAYVNISNKSLEEKLILSKSIETIPQEKKEEVISILLADSNEQVVFNVLKNMGEKYSKTIANKIKNIFVTNEFLFSQDIRILAIQKYCSILNNEAIHVIEDYMKTLTNFELPITAACLQEIYNYGNDSSYEFLKTYLELVFPTDINLLALKTIIKTTYSTKPLNVFKTLIFTIVYYPILSVTEYSIRFYISNNIKTDSRLILDRVYKKENNNMKIVGLDYISHFKLIDEIPFVESLLEDGNEAVRNKARSVLEKLY